MRPEKCDPPQKPNPHVWRQIPVLGIPVLYGTAKWTPLPISASRIARQEMGCGEERGDDTEQVPKVTQRRNKNVLFYNSNLNFVNAGEAYVGDT